MAFSTIVGALKVQVVICSLQVRNLHKMYFAASHQMQFDDVELYVFVLFFFFSIWGNMKQQISLNGRKIKSVLFFCKLTWEKLIQVESPYNQTPLNYANPHAQVIVCSPPHLSPPFLSFLMRTQRSIKGARRNVVAGSYFDILKNLFLFLSANEKWKKWNIFLYLLEKKLFNLISVWVTYTLA